MKEQTAMQSHLQWLNENQLDFNIPLEVIEDAEDRLEMEKQQIIDAHGDEQSHLQDDGSWRTVTSEQYYNETYGSKGSDDHIVDTNEMVYYTEEQVREVIRNCFKSNSLGFVITEDDMMRTIKKDKL